MGVYLFVSAFADQSRAGDCFSNVLVTLQDQLFWTISYPLQLFSPDKVEALANEIQQTWHDVITVSTSLPRHTSADASGEMLIHNSEPQNCAADIGSSGNFSVIQGQL